MEEKGRGKRKPDMTREGKYRGFKKFSGGGGWKLKYSVCPL